jgi:lipopolysaccharide export system permease protein
MMFSATDRYMARLIAVPLFSTLLITSSLLVIDRMRRLFSFIEEQGGPISVVWRMLANRIPEYLGLGIPIGLMLGILLAFRKLALSNELDALHAVGQSYGRLLRVPFMYATVLAVLNFGLVGYVQPVSRYVYEDLMYELRTGAFGASIKVAEFTRFGKDMTLRIESSKNQGRDLTGIFVKATADRGKTLAVTAQTGKFLATDDPDTIIFRLHNGVLVHDAPGFKTPRVLSFVGHDLPVNLPKVDTFRGRGSGGQRLEMTLPDLVRVGGDPKKPVLVRAEVISNFYFRMSEVMMMFLMPLLGVALAVPPKRSTSALGVFLSIIMVVTYHKCNEYAESMGMLGRYPPGLALGLPFAMFAILIIWMYHILAHKPGGQPIGAVERIFGKLTKRLVALFSLFGVRRQYSAKTG